MTVPNGTAGAFLYPASAVPDPSLPLIQYIGDMHHGAISAGRLAALAADLNSGLCPTPTARILVGDQSDNGLLSEDQSCRTWLATLTDGAPYYVAVGNHDILANGRTVANWCASWGYASQNYVVDYAWGRIIVVGPDALKDTTDSTIALSSATLAWLDARLGETSKMCFVVGHAPFYNTAVGPATVYNSTDGGFFIVKNYTDTDSSNVTAVLGAHANCRSWTCGHTHQPEWVPNMAIEYTVGSAKISHVNCSSPYYTLKSQADANTGPLYTTYCNVHPTGALSFYLREHTTRTWYGPSTGGVQQEIVL